MKQKRLSHQFPKAHLWLLIPFIITILGFYFSYWSKLGEVPFRDHGHGITATLWYVLLIIQPWIYNNKSLKLHRMVGFIGLFLAGGVVFSALQVIPYNIVSGLTEYLKYGLSFFDFGALLGFSLSVIMAMIHSKSRDKHSRWMISTVFWVLQPAVSRLIFFPLVIANDGNPPIEFIDAIYLSLLTVIIPILIMIYVDFRKYKTVYKAYLFALCGTVILTLLVKVMGTTEWWIEWCNETLARGLK
ncbi:hypothetical protein MWU50_07570 [Flavobacteriaceae bacterium S0862]|nr:hypothetical protein [Flavobacteriaceae bacterium S0862]